MAQGRHEIAPELLADVRNYLDITWEDEATDSKVRGFIASGMIYLDLKAGAVQDYDPDGLPRTLLMDYARYARDGALDVFENNFRSLLMAMRHERQVHADGIQPPDAVSPGQPDQSEL